MQTSISLLKICSFYSVIAILATDQGKYGFLPTALDFFFFGGGGEYEKCSIPVQGMLSLQQRYLCVPSLYLGKVCGDKKATLQSSQTS